VQEKLLVTSVKTPLATARATTSVRSQHMTHQDLIAAVGQTPLVELGRLAKGLPGRVLAKLEMQNRLPDR